MEHLIQYEEIDKIAGELLSFGWLFSNEGLDLKSKIEDHEILNLREKAVNKSLLILESLDSILNANEAHIINLKSQNVAQEELDKSIITISTDSNKRFEAIIELVISWGIYPNLVEGNIGNLKWDVKGFKNKQDHEKGELLERLYFIKEMDNSKLMKNSWRLMKLGHVAEESQFTTQNQLNWLQHKIRKLYLLEILCAILQIVFYPNNIEKQNEEARSKHPKARFNKALKIIITRTDIFNLIESLLFILNPGNSRSCPDWLKKPVGSLLTSIILRPSGIKIMFSFFADGFYNEKIMTGSYLDNVAKLIMTVPSSVSSMKSYYTKIIPELLDLLLLADQKQNNEDEQAALIQMVSYTLGKIVMKYPSLSKPLIIDPLLSVFRKYWTLSNKSLDVINRDGHSTLIEREYIANSIKGISCLVLYGEPSDDRLKYLIRPYLPPLFELFKTATKSSEESGVKTLLNSTLITYFSQLDMEDSVESLLQILMSPLALYGSPIEFKEVKNGYCLVKKDEIETSQLNLLKPYSLDLDVFLQLCFLIFKKVNSDYPAVLLSSLLEYYSEISENGEPIKVVILVQTIMGLMDKCGIEILKNPKYIIKSCTNLLPKIINSFLKELEISQLANLTNQEDVNEGSESLNLLNILGTIISSCLNANLSQLGEEDWKNLHNLRPYINQLVATNSLDVGIYRTFQSISLLIGAMGIDPTNDNKNVEGVARTDKHKPKEKYDLLKYKQAVAQLQDGLVSVRACGILTIGEIIDAKDTLIYSPDYLEQLFDLILVSMKEEDSFVYLQAIKTMSKFMLQLGTNIVRKLLNKYIDKSLDLEIKLRIGEALLQFVKIGATTLAPMFDEFVDKMLISLLVTNQNNLESKPLDSFLMELENENENEVQVLPLEAIKLSSLSILGTLHERAPLLFLQRSNQLVDIVLNILKLEKSIIVKRAAVMFLYDTIQGLNHEFFNSLSTTMVSRVKETLKLVSYYALKQDVMLARHAERTLNYLIKIEHSLIEVEGPNESNKFKIIKENKSIEISKSDYPEWLDINKGKDRNAKEIIQEIQTNENDENYKGLSNILIDKLKIV